MVKKNRMYLIILVIGTTIIKLNPLRRIGYGLQTENILDRFNLKPLDTIANYITNFDNFNLNIIINFFLTNLLLFLPIAIFLGINGNNKTTNIRILVLLPIIIELLQVVLNIGVFDIDAIIINIISSLLVMNIANKYSVIKHQYQ